MKHLFVYALTALLMIGLVSEGKSFQEDFRVSKDPLVRAPLPESEGLKAVPSAEYLLNNNSQGRDFMFCIPKNDAGVVANLQIFVTSRFATRFTIRGADGTTINRRINRPLEVVTLRENELPAAAWEMNQPGMITNQGISITADEPISVYVMSRQSATADGFLAIPVDALGRNYIHVGYYDHSEFNWGGCFGVVALEDNTTININVRGVGGDHPQAFLAGTNTRIGGRINVRLNRGQTYLVRGSALTRGVFDFTGTEIRANRPIGVVAGHQRTGIPSWSNPAGNRDNLLEMMPPVEAWGRRYATVDLDRGADKGDLMRVIASEDNTNVRIRWWQKAGPRRLLNEDVVRLNAGQFWEFNQDFDPNPQTRFGVVGTSLYEADKPIQVMQYSYSGNSWDGNPALDPFMMLVTPQEQFTEGTIFQTPSTTDFANHKFGIVAIGDPDNPQNHNRLLNSLRFNGTRVTDMAPAFAGNRIPETNLYWAYITCNPGTNTVEGETPFGGYVYGFGNVISYGWPAATALNKIDILDTLPPEVIVSGPCGDYEVRVTELRNSPGGTPPDTTAPQVDQGIRNIDLIEAQNFELIFPPSGRPIPRDSVINFTFRLRVLNLRSPGYAIIRVDDRVGNERIDTIFYEPEFVELSPRDINFGSLLVERQTERREAYLVNPTENEVEVSSLRLKLNNQGFRIIEPVVPPNVRVAAGDSILVVFEYTPTQEHLPDQPGNIDSVFATTQCGDFPLGELRGRGILPLLRVADWNAGEVVIGQRRVLQGGLLLENQGTAPVTVTGISQALNESVQLPFELSTPTAPPFPIVIPPGGGTVRLNEISVTPRQGVETPGTEVVINVRFEHDAAPVGRAGNTKDVSVWRVTPVTPQEIINEHDFLEQRVGTVGHVAEIVVSNEGNTVSVLSALDFSTPGDPAFRVTQARYQGQPVNFPLAANIPLGAGERVVLTVEFSPLAEETFTNSIIARFDNGKELEGNLRGVGIIPAYEGTGYEFDRYNLETDAALFPINADIEIRNVSGSEAMFARNIRLENQRALALNDAGNPTGVEYPAPGVFEIAEDPAALQLLRVGRNSTERLRVRFTPRRDAGWQELDFRFLADVVFETNDVEGPDTTNWNGRTLPLSGEAFIISREIEVAVLNINDSPFGNCADTVVVITVTNPGQGPIQIRDVLLLDDVAGVFDITEFEDIDGLFRGVNELPYGLPAGREMRFFAKFRSPAAGTYTANVVVVSDAGNQTREIRAVSGVLPLRLRVRNADQEPQAGYRPGQEFNIRVAVEGDNPTMQRYGEYGGNRVVDIVEFFLEFDAPGDGQLPIRVNPDQNPTIVGGGGAWDGTFSTPVRDGNSVRISFRFTSRAPITSVDGLPVIDIPFQLFVSDMDGINFRAGGLRVSRRAEGAFPESVMECVTTQNDDTRINLAEYCLQDNRAIKFSGTRFRLAPPKPNPVTIQNATIEFGVGFEVHTKIALYNSRGEEVAVLVDEVRRPGDYSVTLPVENLASGSYVCRMVSGPFTETTQVVIVK